MREEILRQRVGVWGYGSVGKSFIRFLRAGGNDALIHLFDDRPILPEIMSTLQENNIRVYTPDQRHQFLQAIDTLLPSPGVVVPETLRHDVRIYNEYNIFRALWPGKVIGITGTIGKTTVTSLIAHLLHLAHFSVRMGGNIGIPMLDLLPDAHSSMTAVIELSSFQLEYGIDHGPDCAVITNCYPNHLDRHGSFAAYVAAKMNLVQSQVHDQRVLLPYALRSLVADTDASHYSWFIDGEKSLSQVVHGDCATLFWRDGDRIMKSAAGHQDVGIATAPQTLSFIENWLIAYATLDICEVPIPEVKSDIKLYDHRLTHITTTRGISFFNDSKATVTQATTAAVKKIVHEYHRAPVLFLGGYSKGVDRKSFINEVGPLVRHLVIFGAEAAQLHTWAQEAQIPSYAAATLEDAFYAYTKNIAQSGDIVLFSPSGSSYDLFHDFQERGNCFVQLVHTFANS